MPLSTSPRTLRSRYQATFDDGHPNFTFRPEVRWDWYNGPPNSKGQLPFDGFAHSAQFTAGLDLLFTF
jgi:hypothetical protein